MIKKNLSDKFYKGVVKLYIKFAIHYQHKDKYQESLTFYNKALMIQENILKVETMDMILSYNNIGIFYEKSKEYKLAIDFMKKALKVQESIFGTYHLDTAFICNNIAMCYFSLGEFQPALEYFQKTLTTKERLLGVENLDTIISFNNVGQIYHHLGEYQESIKYYKFALRQREKLLGTNHIDTANSYSNIGTLYADMANYKKALDFMTKSLNIQEKMFGVNHIQCTTIYNNIGMYYNNLGNYPKAIKFLNKVLKIRVDVLGEKHTDTANSYNNLGMIYHALQNYNTALKFLQKALDISKNTLGVQHIITANFYSNIGVVYVSLKRYNEALETIKKALKIQKSIFTSNHIAIATSHNNIAYLYHKLDEYHKSIEFYKKALDIQEAIFGTFHRNISDSYASIASVYKDINDYEQAYKSIKQSLSIKKSLIKKVYQNLNASNTQYFYLSQGQNNLAKEFLSISAKYLQNILIDDKKRVISDIYDLWLNNSIDFQDNEAFLSIIANSTNDKYVLEQISLLKTKKYYLAKLLQEQTSKDMQYIIEKEEIEISEIEQFLSKNIEKFKESKNLTNIDIKEIIGYLKDNELFIDFAYTEENIFFFIFQKNKEIDFIEINKEDTIVISKNILKFRKNLTSTIEAINGSITKEIFKYKKDEVNKILYDLYKILIEKYLNPYIKDIQKLIISQDGLLNLLPFETLYDGKRYLLHKKDITYISSGKEFVRLHKFNKKTKLKSDQIKVFANPDYDYNGINTKRVDEIVSDFRMNRAIEAFEKCTKLPNTKKEAESIKTIFPNAELFTEIMASENNLKNIQNSKILHIATHGMVVDNVNEKEALLRCALALTSFNTSIENKKDLGVFTGLKIASLDLKGTDLVVLSACESAKISKDFMDNVASLNRAFMMAGVTSTISSLWEANDAMAEQFFTKYYTKLKEEADYAKVFKETQLEIYEEYKQKDIQHPIFWACFCFFGV